MESTWNFSAEKYHSQVCQKWDFTKNGDVPLQVVISKKPKGNSQM